MASTCRGFKPNFWRSSTCANCYRPKREHSSAKKKQSNNNNKRKGRSKSTEPFTERIEEKPAAILQQQQPRYHMANHSKMVGIVKPYAVVEIDEEEKALPPPSKPLTLHDRRHSEPNIAIHRLTAASLSPMVDRARKISADTGLSSLEEMRRSSSLVDNHSVFRGARDPAGCARPPLHQPRSASSLPRSASNASSLRRFSHAAAATTSQQDPSAPPPPPRRRMTNSASTVDPSTAGAPSQLVNTTQARHVSPKIPSPHPIRKNSAGLVRPSPLTKMTLFSRAKATSFSAADHKEHVILRRKNSRGSINIMKRKRVPPEKPPRTRSTIISVSDQDDLLGLSAKEKGSNGDDDDGGGSAKSQTATLSKVSEIVSQLPEDFTKLALPQLDPMRSSPSPPLLPPSSSTPSPPSHPDSPTKASKIVSILSSALHEILERETGKLVCKDSLWKVSWTDLNIESQTAAIYKGTRFSIEGTTGGVGNLEADVEREVVISRQLPPHLNIQLVRSLLQAPSPPSPLHTLTPSPYHLLRDHSDKIKLGTLLTQQRRVLDPAAYTKLVLNFLVQLFSALEHLFQNGCTHRDVGLECLYASQIGQEWLLQLGNFNYALLRPPPINTRTFVYSFGEISWLGGIDSHLPPEIMDTPEHAQTVNYSLTDSFAAGCTIYEMMGNENPFEKDLDLVNQPYTSEDLPSLTYSSPECIHLQRLAALLLQRDLEKRLSSSTARRLCQAMVWLPQNWLSKPVSEGAIRQWLEEETAQLVADIAKRETMDVPLSMLLKADFILTCKPSELMKALEIFSSK